MADFFTEKDKVDGFLKLQKLINNRFDEKKKFFIGRLSGNETALCGKILCKKKVDNNLFYYLLKGAGLKFNSANDIIEYLNIYLKSVNNCDLLGIWEGGMYYQAKDFYDYINSNIIKEQIPAHSLEFFYYLQHSEYNIHNIFSNKKILVILSHEETLKIQIPKLNLIYPDSTNKRTQGLFSNCSFVTYKPVQQNCNSNDGQSWKVHFEKMKNELKDLLSIHKIDVALVSCGGFGMITCDYLYNNLNTSAIYVGGGLQLFFGILGNRWVYSKDIIELRNENWINPIKDDIPINKELCENGCYW